MAVVICIVIGLIMPVNGVFAADEDEADEIGEAVVSSEENEGEAAEEPVIEVPIDESPESIDQTLAEAATSRGAVTESIVTRRGRDWWRESMNSLESKTGLRFSVDYNSLVQWADKSLGEQLGSSGEFRVTARWRMWGRESGNLGLINFQVRNRHQYSDIPASELGVNIGSLWPTTRGFNDAGWQISHAYYQQYLFERKLTFRLGQSRIDNMFDVHALRGQRLFFLNSAFSDNPSVAFPAFGPTGIVAYNPVERLRVSIGASASDFQQLESVGGIFRRDDWFTAGQIGWTPKIFSNGKSLIQGMYWFARGARDNVDDDGSGVSVLAQHRMPNSFTVFARYGHSEGNAATASEIVSFGGSFKPLPHRRDDILGLAFAWGRPTTAGLRDQYVLEAFHRLQLTPELQITPDVQFIIDPSLNPRDDLIVVIGARARFAF